MPLADLLTPMIARKSIELQRQLPPAQGYLQAQQSMGANPGPITQPANPAYAGGPPAAEQAKVDADYRKRLEAARAKEKVASGVYDSRTLSPDQNAAIAAGNAMTAPGSSPAARGKAFKQYQHIDLNARGVIPQVLPNPGAPTGEPVAFDEAGRPIYAAPQAPMPLAGPHQNQMLMPRGEPVAIDERTGQALDSRGKRMGYLDQEAMNPGVRYLDRRPGDISLDTPKDQLMRDPFARAQLDQMYGKHARQTDENGKFPSGYLQGLKHSDGSPFSKDERANVAKGVKMLQQIQDMEAAQMGPTT